MALLSETKRESDIVVAEFQKRFNRQTVTIADGSGVLNPGTVLGKITGSGEFRAAPAAQVTGDEGAEVAAAVLLETADATAAAVQAVVIRRGPALVNRANLEFDGSVDTAAERQAKIDELEALGIVAREGA